MLRVGEFNVQTGGSLITRTYRQRRHVPVPFSPAFVPPEGASIFRMAPGSGPMPVGAKVTTMLQLEFAAKIRPEHVSEVMLNQFGFSIVSVIGPAALGLTFVTLNVADAVAPTRTCPKSTV